jgi:uncharacterized surface protein with fasciclin (FAS1) repeats
LISFSSCENDNKKLFEDPPWLGGSSIETLEKKGNYTIFLTLMEKAKYKEPISKQLFTLFAPNDEAFTSYFSSIGINSVDDLTEDEAQELFTLHVLRNPRSRYNLIYEYVWSEEQGPTGEYAGLFFRKQTNSFGKSYMEKPRYVPGFPDSMWIYSDTKFMPLFSSDYFEDYFGDTTGGDYTFMYPDGNWPETGLCWGPAAVDSQEVRTADGFIYYIDRVVPPQPNLEKYLFDHQDKFGVFYDMMQRFADYGNAKVGDNDELLYKKEYNTVFNIVEEQGPGTGEGWQMKDVFTLYLPNDQVFQNYLNNTFLKSYGSIDSLPEITMYYLLQSQMSAQLGLISKISKNFFNAFGDQLTITASDIVSSAMCSNGLVYETNKVLEPDVFTCVPGKLFYDKDYTTFLYLVNSSGLLSKLTNPDQKITLFACSNEQIYQYGIRYNKDNDIIEQYLDGEWKSMKTADLLMFIQDHISYEVITDLSGEGYIQMSSMNYIHYKDNKIEGAKNIIDKKPSTVQEKIPNERNGMLYTIDEPILSNYAMGDYIYNNPEFSDFAALLVKAGLLDPEYVDPATMTVVPNLKFITSSGTWTAFIPTNAAMAAARRDGIISDATKTPELRKFLYYHFIKTATIFDDGKQSGDFQTARVESTTTQGTIYSNLTVNNTPGNLQVTDHSGRTTTVSHQGANVLVQRGVVHKINNALKY